MSQIRFYIDEDSMNQSWVRALRARNIDVVTVNETNTAGQLDEEQLMLATEQERVLYSHKGRSHLSHPLAIALLSYTLRRWITRAEHVLPPIKAIAQSTSFPYT